MAPGVEAPRSPRPKGASVIRAAGGVVTRSGETGLEVLVVHRPRYGDWSFPKGKALPGERDEDCALREVEEETGLRCELLDELPTTQYRDRRDRLKRVRYWRMTPVGGELALRHEVDDACWAGREGLRRLLTYSRDVAVVEGLDAD
jgi:8-oxo-dGTP pyrophosphatase MutT (NUDIX family)